MGRKRKGKVKEIEKELEREIEEVEYLYRNTIGNLLMSQQKLALFHETELSCLREVQREKERERERDENSERGRRDRSILGEGGENRNSSIGNKACDYGGLERGKEVEREIDTEKGKEK